MRQMRSSPRGARARALALGHVAVEDDVGERYDGKASACVEGQTGPEDCGSSSLLVTGFKREVIHPQRGHILEWADKN